MNCVEDYGYDNLSLSRVMAGVFSLKITPLNMWVMWIYIYIYIYSVGRDLVYHI